VRSRPRRPGRRPVRAASATNHPDPRRSRDDHPHRQRPLTRDPQLRSTHSGKTVAEARTLSALIDDLRVTQSPLAPRMCRSRSHPANTLRLLDPRPGAGSARRRAADKGARHEPAARARRRAALRARAARDQRRLVGAEVDCAITSTDRAENESSERDSEQSDAAERLVERPRRCVGDGVKVQSRGDGFASMCWPRVSGTPS
jgi:hypothetical protein